ncbi:hypothetical protein [Methylobacterium sp. WL120]|uniref:hypothetical protein n=1 Tax=Methylobacterium sp. WL120 TaxID=2603887 RepID=UPI0011CC36B8|nr:hypothetical protein [Methylobacterium sp. WL120]TXM67231.1 hypothetical protein FV229_10630 [Methylobacterium sp. WL120]
MGGAAGGADRSLKAEELDRAIAYLRNRKAADPILADADLRACQGSPGQDASIAINCMMQRERDRAATVAVRNPSSTVAAAPKPAPASPPVPVAPKPAEAKNVNEILVPGGKLRIVEGDPYEAKSSIRYNDNLVEEFSGVYLGVRAVVFPNYSDAVLIYSTNAGGSGSFDRYGLVSVTEKGKVNHMDLPVGTGRFEYTVGNGRIAFELGLDDGKEVRAVYSDGRLDVTRTAAPMTGLKPEDCGFLYNDVLTQCAEGSRTTCSFDDIGIGMAYQRPINLMAHNDPNFREADFRTTCEQSCKTRKKPSLASFRKAVCLPK